MVNLNDAYVSAYGTNAKVFLRSIGGDPDKIIGDLSAQCAEPNPLAAMLGADSGATVQDAHNAILREIKRVYFSSLSRASAVAVGNAIGELGSISLCSAVPELTFSALTYAGAWNMANPDQEPILAVGYSL